jgi:outer membrane protein assembly factor BamE (lipoprotein component of BamABCDE complex)
VPPDMADEEQMHTDRRFAGFRSASRALGATALALLLAACTWPQEVRGNLPEPAAVAAIEPGISNKADVTRLMGSPSVTGSFDNNTWYYVARRVQRITLQDPEVLEQRVYVVTFDDKGTVTALQTHVNDQHDVAMIPRATPAPGKELSFVEQLLGSFGKFGGLGGDKKKPDNDDG